MKKATTTLLGSSLIGLGILMLVLPGPGILTILAGLAVLGREYRWARRFIKPIRDRFGKKPGAEAPKR